jgi:hypothetical protein
VPTTDNLGSHVFSTFIAMTILQGANLLSVAMVIKFLAPFDFKEIDKIILFAGFFGIPLLFNYYIIYHKRGYRRILKQYASIEKKGNLWTIFSYVVFTMVFFAVSSALVL